MIRYIFVAIFFSCLCLINGCSNAQNRQVIRQQQCMDNSLKILIDYLSRTGNTKAVAEMIQSKVGGDLVAQELENPYPEDYQKIVAQVDDENKRGYLPPLKTKINTGDYDIIFIGFPTWDMQVPPPVKTFLSKNNWTGKTIAKRKAASAAQIALAWTMAQKPFIVPIPGMAKIQYVEDNIKAADVELTSDDLQEIEAKLSEIKIEGDRLSQALLDMDDKF